jgi:hypothetical protein
MKHKTIRHKNGMMILWFMSNNDTGKNYHQSVEYDLFGVV